MIDYAPNEILLASKVDDNPVMTTVMWNHRRKGGR